jgi:hypothetical protein
VSTHAYSAVCANDGSVLYGEPLPNFTICPDFSDTNYSTVLSVSVPAGSYVINSKIVAASDPHSSAVWIGASCQLMVESSSLILDVTFSSGSEGQMAVNQGAITLAAPDTVLLQCQNGTVSTLGAASDGQLVATLVGGLN